ncbi:MAG: hypothetical protein AB2693_16055, partial [Candidatus Thiodiazotropha sp.]
MYESANPFDILTSLCSNCNENICCCISQQSECAQLNSDHVSGSNYIQRSIQCTKSKIRNANKSLACAALNVCGLRRKILYPEFSELVHNYDIFCVCETKLDNYDIVNIPDYTFLGQSRKQRYIRKSGGLGVFVKNSIAPFVTQIDSDS